MSQVLATCHQLLANWYEKADSRQQALQTKIELEQDALARHFEASRVEPMELEAGFAVGWWNGADENKALDIRIACGATSVPGVYNVVSLGLPRPSKCVADLYRAEVLEKVLVALVNAWEPDWAVLTSHDLGDRLYDPDPDADPEAEARRPAGKPKIGWFTYLHAARLGEATGPWPCEVVEIAGRGSLFILTRDHRVSGSRAEDVALARELDKRLEAARALEPIASP